MDLRHLGVPSDNADDSTSKFTVFLVLPLLPPFTLILRLSTPFTLSVMAPLSYKARATPNGLYERYVDKATADTQSLAVINPTTSLFPSRSRPWGGGKYTTRFYLSPNHSRESEACIRLVGEVLSPENGTKMGALGGSHLRPGDVLFYSFSFAFAE